MQIRPKFGQILTIWPQKGQVPKKRVARNFDRGGQTATKSQHLIFNAPCFQASSVKRAFLWRFLKAE